MSQVVSSSGQASSLGRHIPEVASGWHSRLVWKAYTRRDGLFTHRQQATAMYSAPQVMPTVFVVDDDVSVRESLELLIGLAGWRPEMFASAQEFLARPRVVGPTCLVLDVSLPDLNGLELQERVAADRVEMPIIFITGYADIPMTVRAMKAGAVEFLTKPFEDDVMLVAIRNAIEQSQAVLEREAEIQSLHTCYASLTTREREVMALVVSGLLNKQVGLKLGISEITVKAHRGKVMQKMNVDSLAELVTAAGRLRIPEFAFNI